MTNGADNTVTVIDVPAMNVLATVAVGEHPHGLRPSPDGNWVYVANSGGTTVSVIDPSSRYAYITNIYGNDVAVIDLTTQEVVAHIPTGEKPNGISFSPLSPAPASAPETPVEIGQESMDM